MQKVKLIFKTPIAVVENGKPAIKYETETSNHIVASTKSYNNLIENLKQENKIPTNSEVVDLFIDKAKTVNLIKDFISKEINDKETAEYVTNHIIKALDGACVFKKPPVVRAKK